MFAVPSPESPATPNSRRDSRGEEPSTTPAGPPPTLFPIQDSQSFTPAGPPPPTSSILGSSFPSANHSFSDAPSMFAPPPSAHMNGLSWNKNNYSGSGFGLPSSPPGPANPYTLDAGVEDAHAEPLFTHSQFDFTQSEFNRINAELDAANGAPEKSMNSAYDSPRGLKRSRNGAASYRKREAASAYPIIARGLATRPAAIISEPHDIVLQSEALLASLDASLKTASADLDDVLTTTTRQLCTLWQRHISPLSVPGSMGPKNQNSPLDKANYLAALLLRLHHPFTSSSQEADSKVGNRPARLMHLILQPTQSTSVPKALLDWLNTYHNPFSEDLQEVLHSKPSPTANERFWDMVYATTLRGDIATALDLLDNADFAHADTAVDDGYEDAGYNSRQAEAARAVADDCARLLRTCPGYVDGDWDVKNAEWAIFRSRVRHELARLEAVAESDSTDRDNALDGPNVFGSSFGASRNGLSFSTASRRAESKVPWTVYQNLKIFYGQLQGRKTEIMYSAQDWLEAVVYLTAWWDGEDVPSAQSLRRSQQVRPVDVSPTSAYQRQLAHAFASVTEEPEDVVFEVNTLDSVQVGLACICEGSIQETINLLHSWSLPITAAVVDITSADGSLPRARPGRQGLMDGFDQDDLMVLSHGQEDPPGTVKRDDILRGYSKALGAQDEYRSSDGKVTKEGWELACRVLSRSDDFDAAQIDISQLLVRLHLDSAERCDRVMAVCDDIGIPHQSHITAERYADALAETSKSYGNALVFYARAHAKDKLKSTLDLLISMCLVQSAAFPPQATLDPELSLLLNDQAVALRRLANKDVEAAQLMATHLSGYATLRKYYNLRDEEVSGEQPSGLRPLARRREAARALLTLIESAASSISGGLYDAEVETVVQVDALMALLCESLWLMNQPKAILNTPQILTLMRCVEDLQTISASIYEQSEALFRAAIVNYNESPAHLLASQDLAKSVNLAKSTNSLAASTYGLVGSQGSIVSTDGEGERVDVKRAWDWRAGAVHIRNKKVEGTDMLRILRTQLAKEMATCWM